MPKALISIGTLIDYNSSLLATDSATGTDVTALLLDSYLDDDSAVTTADRLLMLDCYSIQKLHREKALNNSQKFVNKIKAKLHIDTITDYLIINQNLYLKYIPTGTIMAKLILPDWILADLKNNFMSFGIDVILTEYDIDYYDLYDAVIMGIFNDNLDEEIQNFKASATALRNEDLTQITEAINSMPIIKDIKRYRARRDNVKLCTGITYESPSVTYIDFIKLA